MMVGRAEGTLDGRPWSCTADGSDIDIVFKGVLGALRARRSLPAVRAAFQRVPALYGANITVKAGLLPRLRVYPKPGRAARVLGVG